MRNKQSNLPLERISKYSTVTLPSVIYSIVFGAILLVAGSVFAGNAAKPQDRPPLSIVVVNVRYLMKNAPQVEIARNDLKERFKEREATIEKTALQIRDLEVTLQKQVDTLSTEDKLVREREIRSRKRRHERVKEDFIEDQRLARINALDEVQEIVFKAIDAVRQRENIDIVLNEYVSASDRVNITNKVYAYLDELSRQKVGNETESDNKSEDKK